MIRTALTLVLPLLAALHAGEAPPPTPAPAGPAPVLGYAIEKIALPSGLDPQIGGLAFTPGGKLMACFHRGEVMVYDPAKRSWSAFAAGLHEPLGVVAVGEREALVMQRAELTRIIDTDGDGLADEYRTVSDDFGISGNYHEFAFGPAMGPDGLAYVGLNVASNGASVFPEVRGEFRHATLTHQDFIANWNASKGKAGRMYAVVPWRGWVITIDPRTGATKPFASGLRSPNSLGFDGQGRLFACDNQGDWVGTSKLFHVEQGGHYGHVASLAWRPEWAGRDPLATPVAELDKARRRAAVLFPHEVMARSPTQPLHDSTKGAFGPYAGQLFVGEMNTPRLLRVALEEVGGQLQGACIPFIDHHGLSAGNNRLAFDASGALWVGHTHLSWGGGDGLQRITFTGTPPMDVHSVSLLERGFRLRFTKPVAAASAVPTAFRVQRYYFEYHAGYGSPSYDKAEVPVATAMLAKDGTSVDLTLPEIKAGYVYDISLAGVTAADGAVVVNPRLCYTVNVLRDGTRAPPMIPATRVGEPPKPPAQDKPKAKGKPAAKDKDQDRPKAK